MEKKLEYYNDTEDSKVWNIKIKGKSIIINFGKKDTKLKQTIIKFETVEQTKQEYNKRIKEKLNKGYQNSKSPKTGTTKLENIIETKNDYIKYLLDISYYYCDYNEELRNKYIFGEKTDKELDKYMKTEQYEKDYNMILKKMTEYHIKKLKDIVKYTDILQNKHVSSFGKSGIIIFALKKSVQRDLLNNINTFANKTEKDYHPGSENRIRDIVHPSLYPYIDKQKSSITDKTDYWNRPYEKSQYQWLPSEFEIDKNGKCHIATYINNLPIEEINIYKSIEKAFDIILPAFEIMWSYIKYIKLYDEKNAWIKEDKKHKNEKISFVNKTLQVIVKIVKIEFDKAGEIEGSWHVEGMSHENIVATATCTLEQTKTFSTELYFKRRYTLEEAGEFGYKLPQNPPNEVRELLDIGMIPLGKTKIKEGTVEIFPNSHIHKVNMSGKKGDSRTIIVFWLINPEVRITSTKDIEQQKYSLSKAYKIRLELMKERTLHKQSFNVRELNLCEH
jgi:predicted DNA-binding WGR domain protein